MGSVTPVRMDGRVRLILDKHTRSVKSLRPVRMIPVGLGLDASAHRMVSQLADRAIDIRLVTFHGYVHDQEMLLARQVRAADDTRTSSAGPPTASDLKRKATERGVAAIRQDARESLDYSVRTYYTKPGITCLQRTTTLPDGVRVRGSHCVTIGEPGKSGSRSIRRPSGCAMRSSSSSGMRFRSKAGSPRTRLGRDGRRVGGVAGGEVGGERAAMAVVVAVAAPSRTQCRSARGEVDRVHAGVGLGTEGVPLRGGGSRPNGKRTNRNLR